MDDRLNYRPARCNTPESGSNAGRARMDPKPMVPRKPRGYQVPTLPRSEHNYIVPISESACSLPRSEMARTPPRYEKGRALPTLRKCSTMPRSKHSGLWTRPEKALATLFLTEGQSDLSAVTAQHIFEGDLGPLPILLTVTASCSAEGFESSLYPYEMSEVLFAYKPDKQFRVLLQDSFNRTLSLPVHSELTFCPDDALNEELTVPEILAQYCLPVDLRFARSQELSFVVHKMVTDHSFFGPLRLTAVYDEPFYWCLSIEPYGNVRNSPKVLPRNLLGVTFAPVTGIRGAADPVGKLKDFMDKYSHLAQRLPCQSDPFFQDLAVVSYGPSPVDSVEPYISERAFITISTHNTQMQSLHSYVRVLHPSPSTPELNFYRRQHKMSTFSGESEDIQYEEPRRARPRMCLPTPPLDSAEASSSFTEMEDFPDSDSRASSSSWDGEEMDNRNLSHFSLHQAFSMSPPPIPKRQVDQDISKVELEVGSYECLRFLKRERQTSASAQSRSLDTLFTGKSGRRKEGGPEEPPFLSEQGPSWKDTLDTLSVEELSVKLKDLGLQKYRKKFSKARIDGVLLQRLTEDNLQQEFQMQRLEILRLNTFIDEGHVPKKFDKKSRRSDHRMASNMSMPEIRR